MAERFIDRHLITGEGDEVRLLGSCCPCCGAVTFPAQRFCPRCTRPDMMPRPLPRTGTLWTYTVQGFRPKPPYDGPEDFTPYPVGYVDLDEVLVESRLDLPPGHQPVIGEALRLVTVPYTSAADAETVTTFAFRPVGAGEEES